MKRFLLFFYIILGLNPAVVLAGSNVWTSIGPDGGTVQAIAVDPQNPDTLYAVAGGAIFKTTDGAANWQRVYSAATTDGRVYYPAITVAVAEDSTLYAGTRNAGVFKSTDGGASWSMASAGLPKPDSIFVNSPFFNVGVLAIDPWNPETIYAGGFSSASMPTLFKSADGGGSWFPASSGLDVDLVTADGTHFAAYSEVYSLAIDPQDPNTLYAAANGPRPGGVFKSTDGGANWSASSAGLAVKVVAIDPRNPSTLYAAGDGVFKSTDGGASWQAASSALPEFILSLAIDPQNPGALYASPACGVPLCTYSQVFKSSDGGTSWTGTGLPFAASSGVAGAVLAIDPFNPNTLYAGTYDGLMKSLDAGADWNAADAGLTASQIDSLAIDPQNAGGFFATSQGKVLRTADAGAHWSEIYTPLPTDDGLATYPASTVVANPSTPGTIYVGIGSGNEEGGGGILKSTDDGTSWKRMPLPGPGGVRTLNLDPQNPSTLVASTNRALYKSTDAGASWNLLFGTNERNYGMPGPCVESVVIDARNPSTLYIWACLPDGRSQGLFKSIDGGQTWSSLGNPLTSGLFGALAIDPQSGDTLYLSGFYDGVLKTTDGGQNWRAFTFTSGLPPTGVDLRSIAVDPQNSNTVYAADYGLGVYRSTNGAANWKPFNPGLADLNLQSLLIDTRNPETVYAGTWDGGVFAVTLPPGP